MADNGVKDFAIKLFLWMNHPNRPIIVDMTDPEIIKPIFGAQGTQPREEIRTQSLTIKDSEELLVRANPFGKTPENRGYLN